MKTIKINYLDRNNNVIASHQTDDEWTAEERAEWTAWLNNGAVGHAGEPKQWDSFELVAVEA